MVDGDSAKDDIKTLSADAEMRRRADLAAIEQSIRELEREKGLRFHQTLAHVAEESRQNLTLDDVSKTKIIVNPETGEIELVTEKRPATGGVPSWFPIAGVCFAAATMLFLGYLLVGPAIDPNRKMIFDTLMAFCVAASAAFLGGSAAAKGQIPFFNNSPMSVSAVGGVGIFVVVFLVLHFST